MILMIDDDINACNVLADYLALEGFTVQLANSVSLALYYILFFKPTLIIADIMMSQLNGYDLIKIIKLDYRLMTIPIIFFSAKGMTNDRIIGYKLGCNMYIAKPFNPKELLLMIRNTLAHNSKFQLTLLYNIKYQNILNSSKKPLKLSFTSREKAILKLVFQGYTNKEIAIQLNLSIRNIEKYISKLLSKTCTRNRTQLVQTLLSLNMGINIL